MSLPTTRYHFKTISENDSRLLHSRLISHNFFITYLGKVDKLFEYNMKNNQFSFLLFYYLT